MYLCNKRLRIPLHIHIGYNVYIVLNEYVMNPYVGAVLRIVAGIQLKNVIKLSLYLVFITGRWFNVYPSPRSAATALTRC